LTPTANYAPLTSCSTSRRTFRLTCFVDQRRVETPNPCRDNPSDEVSDLDYSPSAGRDAQIEAEYTPDGMLAHKATQKMCITQN